MISSLHECLDKQMIAIGHLEVAACYREGTKTYKENQDKGMMLLKEVRTFLCGIKTAMGNFALNEDILGADITVPQRWTMESIIKKYKGHWTELAAEALMCKHFHLPNVAKLTQMQATIIITHAKNNYGLE